MATEVGIKNAALILLGRAPLTSPTDNSEQGRVMAARFDAVRDAVIRAHPWNFAKTRTTLAVLATAPAFGWDKQYQLPTDPFCLRVLVINDDPSEKFEVEGRLLLTDIGAPLKVTYLAQITEPADFDATFAEVMAVLLAARTAYKLTGKRSQVPVLLREYASFLGEARGVDGQEGTANVEFADDFMNSRL